MFCKYCGYQNADESNFCIKCGKLIKDDYENDGFGRGGEQRKGIGFLKIAVCLFLVLLVTGAAFFFAGKEQVTTPRFKQILPIEDGSIAVVYEDGTVRVSGNDHFSKAVSNWEKITRLYYNRYSVFDKEPILVGLTVDGAVLTTEGNISGWQGVDELHFVYNGIVGVTRDGRVMTYGDVEYESILSELKNVETLVLGGPTDDYWGCLKKNGIVTIIDGYSDPDEVYWENVKELRDSGHALYAIQNDGSVVSMMEDDYSALQGAEKVVNYLDWIFGISADGKLLTYKNGNIYTNIGCWMIDEPGSPYYMEEVDIRQFDQVKDILVFDGLILLNKDGTVDTISYEPKWAIDDWGHIEKIYKSWDSDSDVMSIYGIRQDGSVVIARYEPYQMVQKMIEQYRGWNLQDIYTGDGGVVGLTSDGNLVGDGIYANVDFSVFD